MATQFEKDCALMAGAAYMSTRTEKNRFPVPDGWKEIVGEHETEPSGFEANAFQNTTTNEIVISYAGTYRKGVGPSQPFVMIQQ
jgi:hypothetical protein